MLRIAALALFLVACAEPATAQPVPTPTYAEYTILAKSAYSGEAKTGRYVTIVFAGSERETAVSFGCYNDAKVGAVLAPSCR